MITQHPITPPPELVEQWVDNWYRAKVKHDELVAFVATQAARWGADMELEACRLWVSESHSIYDAQELKLARRPKPPSLKEQAMQAWCRFQDTAHKTADEMMGDMATIRRALEQLSD